VGISGGEPRPIPAVRIEELDATTEEIRDGDPTASGVGGVLGQNWRRRNNLSRFLSCVIGEV